MCFGCLKEPSHWDGSFEYPQHMFWMRNKENSFPICTLIWSPAHWYNIGIKHVFLCFNICCTSEGGVETWTWKARVLMTLRGLADVSVSENHVWSLLLHKVILSFESFRKTLRKVYFCITIMDAKARRIRWFWKRLFQSKDLCHPNITKLRTFLCMLLLMTSIFVTAKNVFMKRTQAVHYQHLNCLHALPFHGVRTVLIACWRYSESSVKSPCKGRGRPQDLHKDHRVRSSCCFTRDLTVQLWEPYADPNALLLEPQATGLFWACSKCVQLISVLWDPTGSTGDATTLLWRCLWLYCEHLGFLHFSWTPWDGLENAALVLQGF